MLIPIAVLARAETTTTVTVLYDRVMKMPLDMLTIMGETGQASLVTLVEAGKAVGPPGAKMLVTNDKVFGSLGSPALDRFAAWFPEAHYFFNHFDLIICIQ